MTQVDRSFVVASHCIYNYNLNINVDTLYEYIVLDNIAISGITNFAVIIKNRSSVGNIIRVFVYVSPNNIDYVMAQQNLFVNNIPPNTIARAEFLLVGGFIRTTVIVDANVLLDIHLNGEIN